MKYFLISTLFLIGTVIAQQDPARLVAETLLKRGEVLVQNSLKEIQIFRTTGHGHLVDAFEREVTLTEAFTADLKYQISVLNKTHDVHHLHVIEEELLHRENRLAEELSIIKKVQEDDAAKDHGRAPMIAFGEQLVKKAKELIAKSPNSREASAIAAEVASVEQLISAIKGKPESANLKNEEEQLDRHEASLDLLFLRFQRQNGV